MIGFHNPTSTPPEEDEINFMPTSKKKLLNLSASRNSTHRIILKLRSRKRADERGEEKQGREGDTNDEGDQQRVHTRHTLPVCGLLLLPEPPAGAEHPHPVLVKLGISLLGPEVVILLGVGQLLVIVREGVVQSHFSSVQMKVCLGGCDCALDLCFG